MRPERLDNEKKKPASLLARTGAILMIALVASVLWNVVGCLRLGYTPMMVELDEQVALFAAEIIEREPFLLKTFLALEHKLASEVASVTLPKNMQPKNKASRYHVGTHATHQWNTTAKKVGVFFSHLWHVMQLSFLLVAIKFIGIMSSVLLFLFSGLLGCLDGLQRRYVRTIEAGRESTYLYHNISALFKQVPMMVVLVYLLAPLSIPTTWVIGLISIALFIYCDLFFTNLKKFL